MITEFEIEGITEEEQMQGTQSLPADAESARLKALLAHIEKRKNDRAYFDSWEAQVTAYRRKVQEDAERELAEEGK